ncbi:MAG: hypothetical protein PHV77_03660 [Candidatus Omnitrophica bacterium]|jgi:hypothetical protein|nr:hypothetical protein [Candidatus Omnitrophota bacterium]
MQVKTTHTTCDINSRTSVIRDDVDLKKLLDVISSIMVDEYIEIAKENPDTFKNGGTK